ncbi:hypothetical protein V5O48_011841, partial [Marasmius crinis-equi]
SPTVEKAMKPQLEHSTLILCAKCQQGLNACASVTPVNRTFLRSDYILSELETIRMAELLTEEERENEQYEKDIANVREILWRLESGQRELQTNMIRRRGALSLLRQIPPEIWEIIFSIVCTSTEGGYSLHIDCVREPHIYDTPLVTLSQVCSRWRQITVGCPKLWTSISIQFAELLDHSKHPLKLFLENSKECHLNVRVRRLLLGRSRYPSLESPIERDNWKLLTQYLWRCEKLTLDTDDFSLPALLPRDAQISFPHLLEYVEEIPDDYSDLEDSEWGKALLNAPKLNSVTTHFLRPLETLPYHQLTSLKIRYLYADEATKLYNVLPVCTQLRFLTLGLEDDGLEDEDGISLDSVELPSLRTLIIECSRSTPTDVRCPLLEEVLKSLRLPVLESLRLHCDGDTAMVDQWPAALLEMLERTSTLQKLFLFFDQCYGVLFDPGHRRSLASALLRAIPNVEVLQLALHRTGYTDKEQFRQHMERMLCDLFFQLAQLKTGIAPKLTDLRLFISDINMDGTLVEALLQTATARSPSALAASEVGVLVGPLSEISITRFPTLSYDEYHSHMESNKRALFTQIEVGSGIRKRMQDLEEDGVKVIIEGSDGPPPALRTLARRW